MPDLPKMKTVGDIVDLINQNARSNNIVLREHALTLLGPRKRGSTTIFGIEQPEFSGIQVKLIQHDLVSPDCHCYLFKCPQMMGELGAIPLSLAFAKELPVLMRDGSHGPELFVDRQLFGAEYDNNIYAIIGWHDEEPAVFTWHPGPPLARLSDGLTPMTAVKLHNG